MSSSDGLGAFLSGGVGEHGAADDVGEASLERPDGFLAGGSCLQPLIEVGAGLGVRSGLGECHAVNRCVELTVTGPAESVACGIA